MNGVNKHNSETNDPTFTSQQLEDALVLKTITNPTEENLNQN